MEKVVIHKDIIYENCTDWSMRRQLNHYRNILNVNKPKHGEKPNSCYMHYLLNEMCFSPISSELTDKLTYKCPELRKILLFTNQYIWYKIDLELYAVNYVKRRIVNSRLEKCYLHGDLTKDEFLLLTTNLLNNTENVRNQLLNESLPF